MTRNRSWCSHCRCSLLEWLNEKPEIDRDMPRYAVGVMQIVHRIQLADDVGIACDRQRQIVHGRYHRLADLLASREMRIARPAVELPEYFRAIDAIDLVRQHLVVADRDIGKRRTSRHLVIDALA